MKRIYILLIVAALLSASVIANAEQPADIYGSLIQQSASANRYAKVKTSKGTLNMRAEANDKSKVVSKLPKGSIVRLVNDNEAWAKIEYKNKTGYVKTGFIEEIKNLPYGTLLKGDKSDAVLSFQKALHKLGYIKSEEISSRYDETMEAALTKLQLLNDLPLNPREVTAETQALMEWGMLDKCKSGYLDTASDKNSGLTLSVFCWDSDGTLYDADKSVKLKISYATNASGGSPPYTITVRKSLSGGGPLSGDPVASPFSHIWSYGSDRVYVYATVVDAIGNSVTACAPFKYMLPTRYLDWHEGGLG